MRSHVLSILFVFFIVLMQGCATTAVQEPTLVYPTPPEEPRIVYIKRVRGESDFRKTNIFDAIFGGPPATGLPKPYGVFAQGDKIFTTLSTGQAVAVIDLKERKMAYIGDAGRGKLAVPIGIAGSPDGTIFVSDTTLNRVFGYDRNGELKLAIGKAGTFGSPAGLAVNGDLGRLYIVDTKAHTVHVFSLKGEPLFRFGNDGGGSGQFHYPTNVAIDKRNGNVYITDTQNFRVQVFDKDGKFLRKFGEIGDRPGFFSRPRGIAVDSEGHVYVADAAFNNFQIFDEEARLLMFVGSAGPEPGQFLSPAGMYIDENDRIYVVDSLNNRLQVFQYLSEKWKKEHPEEYKKYLQ